MRSFRAGPAGGFRLGRRDGFTLVEIIVVMAIIVLLFGLVAVSIGHFRAGAAEKNTLSLIQKLELWLDEYKRLTGHYPPDGIDSAVRNEEGERIQGSACLYYFLSRPVVYKEQIGGRSETKEAQPLANFRGAELTPENPEFPGVREIVDGWATPLHYDNTEDGVYRPQGGEVHFPPLEESEHPPDPRDGTVEVDGAPAVAKSGIQGRGFDIWSHGEQGHEVGGRVSLPIATWNIQR